jgi:hypothetical protein
MTHDYQKVLDYAMEDGGRGGAATSGHWQNAPRLLGTAMPGVYRPFINSHRNLQGDIQVRPTSQSRTARSLTFLLKISHNVAKVGKGNAGGAVLKTFLIENILRKNKIDMLGRTDIGMPVANIDDP